MWWKRKRPSSYQLESSTPFLTASGWVQSKWFLRRQASQWSRMRGMSLSPQECRTAGESALIIGGWTRQPEMIIFPCYSLIKCLSAWQVSLITIFLMVFLVIYKFILLLRIKKRPHYFHDTNAKNDDLEILCKTGYACTYADTQMSNFYGHVMLGLIIHFLYFSQPSVSKICSFINLCIHPSPFRASGDISQHSPFRCIHIFFLKKTSYDQRIFSKKSWKWSLSKACWFFS